MQSIMNEIKRDYLRIRNIFNQIFDGVEYLHSEGVYHRDLKPANILMNSDVDLVISDFGLGVQRDSTSIRLTRTLMGMGTEFFASPEQMMDAKNVDEKTDIYSLGCMIYLCFIEEDWDTHIVLEKMPSVIDYVVRKATAYRKESRFQSIESLRQSFNAAIDRLLGVKIKDDFEDILDQIKSEDSTEEFIDTVSLTLSSSLENPDHIHEVIMSLSQDQFTSLCSKHFDITKRALSIFKEHITNQGWTFKYTDTVGRQCHNLYYSMENFELRAILIYIIVQVGSNHNRWYVMNLAKEILQAINNDSEAFEVASYIDELTKEISQLDLRKKDLHGELKKIVV